MAKVALIFSRSSAPHPADELGVIRAEMADLKAREAAVLADIKALGAGRHEGAAFGVTVSHVEGRLSLDPKAAEAKLRELGVDGRWFSKHMKQAAGSVRVTCSALQG